MGLMRPVEVGSVVVAAAGTLSSAFRMDKGVIPWIYIPSGFQGTTIVIHGSIEGTTFASVKRLSGIGAGETTATVVALTITVAAGDLICLADLVAGLHSFKVLCGTTQDAARTFPICCTP